MNDSVKNIINTFLSITSPRFVSFIYRAKGTGELSKYTILVGAKYINHVKFDLKRLISYAPKSTEETVAVNELINSMVQTITKGVSDSYTKQGYYTHDGNNIKTSVKDVVYLNGYFISKTVIEPPTITTKKSVSLKEQIKRSLHCKTTKFREFRLSPENIVSAKVNGRTLEIETSY